MEKEINKTLNNLDKDTIRGEFLQLILDSYDNLSKQTKTEAEETILYVMIRSLNNYIDFCEGSKEE